MHQKNAVILFIEFCRTGGPPQRLLDQIRWMQHAYPHRFTYIVIGAPGSILGSASKNGAFYYYALPFIDFSEQSYWSVSSFFAYLSLLFTIMKIVMRQSVSIIHCNHYQWCMYANPIGLLLGKPVVIHLRDIWPLPSKLSRILLKCNPSASFIAISRYTQEIFTRKFKLKTKKMHLVYDGIDNTIFSALPRNTITKKHAQRTKLVCMFSRIEKERNIEVFLDAAYLILQRYPRVKFRHFGYYPAEHSRAYFSQLKKQILLLGKPLQAAFHFYPYVTDRTRMAKLLKTAFFTIVPAEQFALPNTAIESIMCSTPVIALRTGGNPEIIKDGVTGILVDVNSPIVYADRIMNCLDNADTYIRVSEKGAVFAHRHFASDIQYGKIVHIYENLL